MRSVGIFLLALTVMPPAAADERYVSFVACPIMRDTIDVPCWLAEHEGTLFYLTKSEDLGAKVYPPQLKHRVLVEGVVADGERICGGIVLEPVELSVLPEVDLSCTAILPADGHYVPANRYPGPSDPPARRRAAALAAEAARLTSSTRREEAASKDEFVIDFTFDSDFLYGRTFRRIIAAAERASATEGKLEVIGYRASSRLSNGEVLIERAGVSQARAERVGEVLRDAGEIDSKDIDIKWVDEAAPANGIDDPSRRRAVIHVRR